MKKIIALLLAVVLATCALAGCAGPAASSAAAASPAAASSAAAAPDPAGDTAVKLDGSWPEETIKIGVVTFDTTDESFLGVQKYYDSLKASFNVDFIYSESITAAEGEFAFIDAAAAAGCKGIIAYYNIAGAEAIKQATSRGMYYWGVEEYYEAAKDDPLYLGCYTFLDPTDPNAKNGDYLAGYDLGYSMSMQGVKKIAYCSGGASFGVQMFIDRQQGFVEGVAAAQKDGSTVAFDAAKDIIAGWPGTDDFAAAQSAAIAGDYDAVASAFNVAMWFQPVMESGKSIKLGAIGVVNETYKAFMASGVVTALVYDCEETVFGAGVANIINAATGHPKLAQNADGTPLKNYTTRWTVSDSATFDAVYDHHAAGKYFVTPEDLASVLGGINPGATSDDVVKLFNLSIEDAVASIK